MSTRVKSLTTSLASGAAELSLVTLLHAVGARAVVTFSVVQIIGATITFMLNKHWVFDAARTGTITTELSRAAPVVSGAFVLNTALPSIGTSVAGIRATVAYLASQTLVYLLWSFPLNRRWVFRRPVQHGGAADPIDGTSATPPLVHPAYANAPS